MAGLSKLPVIRSEIRYRDVLQQAPRCGVRSNPYSFEGIHEASRIDESPQRVIPFGARLNGAGRAALRHHDMPGSVQPEHEPLFQFPQEGTRVEREHPCVVDSPYN